MKDATKKKEKKTEEGGVKKKKGYLERKIEKWRADRVSQQWHVSISIAICMMALALDK